MKVLYDLGKYGTEEEGKMRIDIFTFQKNPLACVRAHQGVVTFCFHNLHKNRGRTWGDRLKVSELCFGKCYVTAYKCGFWAFDYVKNCPKIGGK